MKVRLVLTYQMRELTLRSRSTPFPQQSAVAALVYVSQ